MKKISEILQGVNLLSGMINTRYGKVTKRISSKHMKFQISKYVYQLGNIPQAGKERCVGINMKENIL